MESKKKEEKLKRKAQKIDELKQKQLKFSYIYDPTKMVIGDPEKL